MAAATITLPTYLGVGIVLIVFASAFVCIRCLANSHFSRRKLGIDDCLIFLIATFAVNYVISDALLGPVASIDLIWLQKISVVIIILVQGTLWFSKAPIIFLYLKLFGVNAWLRYVSWATLLVAGLVYIAGLIFTLVKCPVNPDLATFPIYQECAYSNTLTGVISGFVSVVFDAIMFVLPIPIIAGLQLGLSKKIGLGLTFFSGILGIVASVVSLYYKWQALYGNGTQFTAPIMCFTIEAVVAIMVGCAPAVKAGASRFITPSNSKTTRNSAYPHSDNNYKSVIHTRGSGWEGSDEHINVGRGRASPYIQMEAR